MKRVISISGRARHGKDTVAKIMCKYLDNSITIAFADYLKELACNSLGISNIDELNRYKNSNILYNGINIREYLQELADNIKERYSNEYFIDIVIVKIKEAFKNNYDYIIITDTRLLKELDKLKYNFGDLVVSLKVIRNINGTLKVIKHNNHNSEIEVDLLNTEYVVMNDNTIDVLEYNIKMLLKEF